MMNVFIMWYTHRRQVNVTVSVFCFALIVGDDPLSEMLLILLGLGRGNLPALGPVRRHGLSLSPPVRASSSSSTSSLSLCSLIPCLSPSAAVWMLAGTETWLWISARTDWPCWPPTRTSLTTPRTPTGESFTLFSFFFSIASLASPLCPGWCSLRMRSAGHSSIIPLTPGRCENYRLGVKVLLLLSGRTSSSSAEIPRAALPSPH